MAGGGGPKLCWIALGHRDDGAHGQVRRGAPHRPHPLQRVAARHHPRRVLRAAQSTFWCIIRGLEAHAVLLGNLQLPAAARLVACRLPPQPVSQLQLLALAQAPAGVGGALLTLSR